MRYSVVIPTYNRPQTLLFALTSIAKQTLSPKEYEILVCDDGSPPDTTRTVLKFIKEHPQNVIRYYYHQNGGPAKARNTGIKHAKGEIIFFTDDDCVVPENWMEKLLDGYKRYPEAVGVGGWYGPANDKLSQKYFQKYLDFLEKDSDLVNTETLTNIFGASVVGNTANMSYKKSVLDEVGGFDENLNFPGAVDWEFKKNVQSLGYRLLYVPIMVGHLKDFSLDVFAKKFFNQGRGRYYMTLKYPDLQNSIYYNVTLKNSLKQTLRYAAFSIQYFPAHIIGVLFMCAGRYYSKYINPFPEIKPSEKHDTKEWVVIKIGGRSGNLK